MTNLKECKKCEDVVIRDNILICSILEKPCEYISQCPHKDEIKYDEITVIGLFRSMRPDIM